jgi:ferric iron reductase protein FhuF
MTATLRPLEPPLNRLAAASEHFRAKLLTEPDAEPGWLSTAELAAEGAPHLAEVFWRVTTRYKTSDQQAPAALWFGRYAFAIAAAPIACYLAAQRVPALGLSDVWIRFEDDGDIGGLAWRSRSFAALADDPEAGHPDCRVVSSRDALRDHLRDQLIAHFTPMIEAVRARSAMGKAGLWALAADYAANAFTWVARLWGDEAGGAAEARLFSASASPLRRQRDFICVNHCGLSYYLLDRVSCCLYYKVEGGKYCSSCPHRAPQERVDLIKGWLEKQAAGVMQT